MENPVFAFLSLIADLHCFFFSWSGSNPLPTLLYISTSAIIISYSHLLSLCLLSSFDFFFFVSHILAALYSSVCIYTLALPQTHSDVGPFCQSTSVIQTLLCTNIFINQKYLFCVQVMVPPGRFCISLAVLVVEGRHTDISLAGPRYS